MIARQNLTFVDFLPPSKWPHIDSLHNQYYCRNDDQHRFSLHGVNPTLARTSFFCRRLSLSFAPIAPLPPDGFVLVRWEGGLYGDFCASGRRFSSLPAAGRFGRATWSIDFLLEKKSGVRYHYKMFVCVHSCKDTLSFSYCSLSLSLSSSSVDRCVVE